MADFKDQPGLFSSYRFQCHWPARAQSASDIAQRFQALARAFGEIEPVYGELWPLLAMRPIRPSEPHLLQFSQDELADLIERRLRFNPPRWPEPVSQDGYQIVVGANRRGVDPLSLGVIAFIGAFREGKENEVSVSLHRESPIWRRPDCGRALLHALVDAFHPTYAFSGAPYESDPSTQRSEPWRFRPCFAWSADGVALPDYLEPPGPPVEESVDRGGRLSFWP